MRHYERVMAEVDLGAIEHNYREIRRNIDDDVSICGVIKADGYGHGALPVAKYLNELGVESFAVAASHEAVALRKQGIKGEILVLGFTAKEDYPDLIRYNVTQTIFREDMAVTLSEVAMSMGQKAKIHIKIDTGMGRIGFTPEECNLDVVERISRLPLLILDGIFSHFSKADERDKEYSVAQLDRYLAFTQALKDRGVVANKYHLSNSAGLIDLKKAHFDMVRVGIALYGLYPSDEVSKELYHLKPVLSLKSNVIMVKEVAPGTSISYGGTYITKAPTIVATIPVGYGDGYPRALSSKGHVLIRGVRCPIIGRVCMDQFMVDATGVKEVEVGDTVTLIGQDGNEFISVEEIALHMDTINYEVVCQLGKRIPRVYLKDQKPAFSIDYF